MLKTDLEKLVAMKKELGPAIKQMAVLEKKIKAEILETQDSPIVEGVDVTLRSKYIKTSWDSKELDKLGEIIPEILQCKKHTEVKESVAFKFA